MAFVPRPRDQLAVSQAGASTGTNDQLRLQLEVRTQKRPAKPAFLIFQRNDFCLEREREELPHVRFFLLIINSVQRVGQDNLLTAAVACGSTWV